MEQRYETAAAGYYEGAKTTTADSPRQGGVHRALGSLDTNIEMLAKILAEFDQRLNTAGVLQPDSPAVKSPDGGINRIEQPRSSLADSLAGAAARVRTNCERLAALMGRMDL